MSQRFSNFLMALAALFFWAAVAVLAITNPRLRRDGYPFPDPTTTNETGVTVYEGVPILRPPAIPTRGGTPQLPEGGDEGSGGGGTPPPSGVDYGYLEGYNITHYYRHDETSRGWDVVGGIGMYNNSGSIVLSATVPAGYSGNAHYIGYVDTEELTAGTVGTDDLGLVGRENWTVGSWVKVTDFDSGNQELYYINGWVILARDSTADRPRVAHWQGSWQYGTCTTNSWPFNEYVHIALIAENGTFRVLVNGDDVSVSMPTYTGGAIGSPTGNYAWDIGNYTGERFGGLVDETFVAHTNLNETIIDGIIASGVDGGLGGTNEFQVFEQWEANYASRQYGQAFGVETDTANLISTVTNVPHTGARSMFIDGSANATPVTALRYYSRTSLAPESYIRGYFYIVSAECGAGSEMIFSQNISTHQTYFSNPAAYIRMYESAGSFYALCGNVDQSETDPIAIATDEWILLEIYNDAANGGTVRWRYNSVEQTAPPVASTWTYWGGVQVGTTNTFEAYFDDFMYDQNTTNWLGDTWLFLD